MMMKHLFTFCGVLFISMYGLVAADLVTLVVAPGAGTRFSEQTIVLETGDSAKVEFNGRALSNGPPTLEVQIGTLTFDMAAFVDPAYGANGVPTIAGPATIRAKKTGGDDGPSLATIAVQRAGSNANGVPLNAAVIPEDAEGQYQVLLESSTDLITWTPTMPGSYGGGTIKRFFRTRVVKLN